MHEGRLHEELEPAFFALIGSTIYYGTSPIDLSIQPKLFAHMHDVVNLVVPPRQCALAPHPHTFALEVMGTPRTRSRSVVTGNARGKPSGMLSSPPIWRRR